MSRRAESSPGARAGRSRRGRRSTRVVGQTALAWRRFCANRLAVGSLVVVGALVVCAVAAPVLAPYGYATTDYDHILTPPGEGGHLLGTDTLGRDILSRLMFGLRTALLISCGATLLALLIALAIGMAAAVMKPYVDNILMAITDTMFAFPMYLLTILMVTSLGRSLTVIGLAIGIASWVTLARLVRAEVMSQMLRGYAEAGRAMGASRWTIAVRYVLPNITGSIIVAVSFGIPAGIIAESGLALLGLGVQPPTPSWGGMISEGSRMVLSDPNLLVWPTALFAVTVLAFTWVGDGFRDAFDVATETS